MGDIFIMYNNDPNLKWNSLDNNIKELANINALINVYMNINICGCPIDNGIPMSDIVNKLGDFCNIPPIAGGISPNYKPQKNDMLKYSDYYNQYQKLKNACVNNPTFANLTIDNQFLIDNERLEGGMYAATFKDEANKSVYFAYCGTKEREWLVNGEGLSGYWSFPSGTGVDGTAIQKMAVNYFDGTMTTNEKYFESVENIYITGHSTGGNRAQYVTLCSQFRDRITQCFNFDGQGFSGEFISWYIETYGVRTYIEQNGVPIHYKEWYNKSAGATYKEQYSNNYTPPFNERIFYHWLEKESSRIGLYGLHDEIRECGKAEFTRAAQKMYGINGENDFVNVLGLTIIPSANLFYFVTPYLTNFEGYHFWDAYLDEKGHFTNPAERGPVANLFAGISKNVMRLDPEQRVKITLFLMTLFQNKNPSI